MAAQPKHSRTDEPKTRARTVKQGRMPVSEFAFDRAGAGSPFGDDLSFPMPVELLTYEPPTEAGHHDE
jgi:hypothetical protein